MIERMPASSPFPEHVYIGYLLWARPKDGKLTHKLFYEKETSFAKVKKKVETKLATRRVPRPGVGAIYLQRKPHELIAATNVSTFVEPLSKKDVCVGRLVTSNAGVSEFISQPKRASKLGSRRRRTSSGNAS